MKALEHFRAGRLADAIQNATESVRAAPTDVDARWVYAQLLCFTGDYERADQQLDVISRQDEQAMVGTTIMRQLIRAGQARRQFFAEGRLPEFVEQPSKDLQLRLEASVLLREGDSETATERLKKANEQLDLAGEIDGVTYEDFRDLDDLLAGVLEIGSSNGTYYWIGLDQVESLTFHAPQQPCDYLWRPADIDVRNGPSGTVFVPVCYDETIEATDDDALRLGRATEWVGENIVRGRGHRMYLVGGESKPLTHLQSIQAMRCSTVSSGQEPA